MEDILTLTNIGLALTGTLVGFLISKILEKSSASKTLNNAKSEAEKRKLPSPLWKSVKGGIVRGLMILAKGKTPISKAQMVYQEEAMLPNQEKGIFTKDQLTRMAPQKIDDTEPGWEEWERMRE